MVHTLKGSRQHITGWTKTCQLVAVWLCEVADLIDDDTEWEDISWACALRRPVHATYSQQLRGSPQQLYTSDNLLYSICSCIYRNI